MFCACSASFDLIAHFPASFWEWRDNLRPLPILFLCLVQLRLGAIRSIWLSLWSGMGITVSTVRFCGLSQGDMEACSILLPSISTLRMGNVDQKLKGKVKSLTIFWGLFPSGLYFVFRLFLMREMMYVWYFLHFLFLPLCKDLLPAIYAMVEMTQVDTNIHLAAQFSSCGSIWDCICFGWEKRSMVNEWR